VNVLEDRLLFNEASDIDSRLSNRPAGAGGMFGDDAVVVGCEGCRLISLSASFSRT